MPRVPVRRARNGEDSPEVVEEHGAAGRHGADPEGTDPPDGGWEPLDATDLVGAASARLYADGVSSGGRLDALRLLGLLSDHADPEGRVRMSFEALAAEFSLDLEVAQRSLAALQRVQMVADADGELTLAAVEPPAAGGLRLSGFLAEVAAVQLDVPVPHPAPVVVPLSVTAPSPAPAPEVVVLAPLEVPSGSQPGTVHRRSGQPYAAALVAAAVILLVALVPGLANITPAERQVGLTASSSPGASDTVATPTTSAPVPSPGADTGTTAPGETIAVPATPAGPEPGNTTAVPTTGAPTSSTAPGATTVPPPATTGAPVATTPTNSPPATGPTGATIAPALCPTGAPVVAVSSVASRPLGAPSAPVGTAPRTPGEVLVTGTLSNPTSAPVRVSEVAVHVAADGFEVIVAALAEPAVLAPGASAPWQVLVPLAAAGSPPTVRTELGEWRWADARTADACPI